MSDKIKLVYATSKGELRFEPELKALGAAGEEYWEVTEEDLIPLPPGANLFYLPGRQPLGLEIKTGEVEKIDEQEITAVAAILPQGYTRLLLPAYQRLPAAPRLPLFGYTAVAFMGEQLYVAARCTDDLKKWDPLVYNLPALPTLIKEKIASYPRNRILRQLAKCAQEYHCFTAQNIFYERWEGGIPVSPTCNAQCLGCISKQVAECCPSPQGRINFHPSSEEVVEVALPHLDGEEAIISFGQGCEGEPLLAWPVIKEAITAIRKKTSKGTININTNAGLPKALEELAEVGLNSARISIFSMDPDFYCFYHQPQGFDLLQVGESIRRLRKRSVFVSLNLLALPGFTDRKPQMERMFQFLDEHPVNMIQIRNLNIDPDFVWGKMKKERKALTGEVIGMANFLDELAAKFPEIIVGNYSRAL